MTQTQKNNQIFKYNKAEKRNKNFMYMDFRRGNCYNCDFSCSNFSYPVISLNANLTLQNSQVVTLRKVNLKNLNLKM